MLDQPNFNARKARWIAFLSEYDFEIQHIKAKENKDIDALSRNAKLNFTAAISTYMTDLEEQLEVRIEQDENYQKNIIKSKREFNRKYNYKVQLE